MSRKYLIEKIRQYGMVGFTRKAMKRFVRAQKYPAHISLEVMTQCNLKCRHCRVTYHGDTIPNVNVGFMKYDLFKEVVDHIIPMIRHAETFQFSTIEPLFHKRIFDMMDYVSQHNGDISFPLLSNGMILNEKNIQNILVRNVPSISISLDGCKKETVEPFKTGADFDKIVQNIKLVKEITGSKVKIYTVFVATKNNIDELVEYVDFCASLHVDGIYVNGFLSFLPETADLYLYSKHGNDRVHQIFLAAYERARQHGIMTQFPSLTAKSTGCNYYDSMCIDENGDIAPCIFLDRETPLELFGRKGVTTPVKFGNVLREDALSIWSNKAYQDFRNKLKSSSSEIPDECVLCADAYGVMSSNRTFMP